MIDLDNSRHSTACNLNAIETGQFDLCTCGLAAAREDDERQRREAEISTSTGALILSPLISHPPLLPLLLYKMKMNDRLPRLVLQNTVRGAEYRSDRPGRLKRLWRRIRNRLFNWLSSV